MIVLRSVYASFDVRNSDFLAPCSPIRDSWGGSTVISGRVTVNPAVLWSVMA